MFTFDNGSAIKSLYKIEFPSAQPREEPFYIFAFDDYWNGEPISSRQRNPYEFGSKQYYRYSHPSKLTVDVIIHTKTEPTYPSPEQFNNNIKDEFDHIEIKFLNTENELVREPILIVREHDTYHRRVLIVNNTRLQPNLNPFAIDFEKMIVSFVGDSGHCYLFREDERVKHGGFSFVPDVAENVTIRTSDSSSVCIFGRRDRFVHSAFGLQYYKNNTVFALKKDAKNTSNIIVTFPRHPSSPVHLSKTDQGLIVIVKGELSNFACVKLVFEGENIGLNVKREHDPTIYFAPPEWPQSVLSGYGRELHLRIRC